MTTAEFGRNTGMKERLEAGDLIRVEQQEGARQWTLCNRYNSKENILEECLSFVSEIEDHLNRLVYRCFHGKVGLIKKVTKNKLDQPIVYEIEFPEGLYSCRALLAGKYLKKVTK
tara:strand:- start:271 stop:615 length:345 start_codon:yes stop_codon:yes gene_type:complete